MLRPFRAAIRDIAGELLYVSGLTRPERAGASRLNVVTFHRVLPEKLLRDYPLPEIAVSDTEFRWFVTYFAAHFTVDTLAGSCRRWEAGERPERPFLAITFDDGQRDNYLYARPILESAGMRGSFFVPVQAIEDNGTLWHDRLAYAAAQLVRTSKEEVLWKADAVVPPTGVKGQAMVRAVVERAKRIPPLTRDRYVDHLEAAAGGLTRPEWDGMMRWDELRSLVAGGHEVGSHSMTHQILVQLDDARLEHEVAGSKRMLEEKLGTPVPSFCYPNGDADERVVRAVQDAGYTWAVTTRWGANRPGTPPLELTRCDIQSHTSRDRRGALSQPRVALRLSHYFPGPRA